MSNIVVIRGLWNFEWYWPTCDNVFEIVKSRSKLEANSVAVDGQAHHHHHASWSMMVLMSLAIDCHSVGFDEAWWWRWVWPSTATELASMKHDGEDEFGHRLPQSWLRCSMMVRMSLAIDCHRVSFDAAWWWRWVWPSTATELASKKHDGEDEFGHRLPQSWLRWSMMVKMSLAIDCQRAGFDEAWWWRWVWPSTATELASMKHDGEDEFGHRLPKSWLRWSMMVKMSLAIDCHRVGFDAAWWWGWVWPSTATELASMKHDGEDEFGHRLTQGWLRCSMMVKMSLAIDCHRVGFDEAWWWRWVWPSTVTESASMKHDREDGFGHPLPQNWLRFYSFTWQSS